jgi:hexokinase
MYLGEVVRNILLALVDATPKPMLFDGKSTSVLNTHYGLDTSVMSDVENAWEAAAKFKKDTDVTPQYSNFTPSDAEKTALEQVRKVVVQRLGFTDADVTIRDAAVS